jgi:Flp pilus assembly protein TadD
MGCLREGNMAQAEEILLDVWCRCPDTYQYDFVEDGKRYVKFWDMQEFLSYAAREGRETKEEIAWIASAYPRACYYLAFLSVERRDFTSALKWLKKGQRLEPHNAKFLNETGIVYSLLKDCVNALASYEAALALPSASHRDQAVALRGAGVQLIELGRIEEAKEKLVQSLKIEPNSDVAKNELAYIVGLQAKPQGTVPQELLTLSIKG